MHQGYTEFFRWKTQLGSLRSLYPSLSGAGLFQLNFVECFPFDKILSSWYSDVIPYTSFRLEALLSIGLSEGNNLGPSWLYASPSGHLCIDTYRIELNRCKRAVDIPLCLSKIFESLRDENRPRPENWIIWIDRKGVGLLGPNHSRLRSNLAVLGLNLGWTGANLGPTWA